MRHSREKESSQRNHISNAEEEEWDTGNNGALSDSKKQHSREKESSQRNHISNAEEEEWDTGNNGALSDSKKQHY